MVGGRKHASDVCPVRPNGKMGLRRANEVKNYGDCTGDRANLADREVQRREDVNTLKVGNKFGLDHSRRKWARFSLYFCIRLKIFCNTGI